MTREEEIDKAGMEWYSKIKNYDAYVATAFLAGAKWADAHPRWISVKKELPPRFKLDPNVSVNVLAYGFHTMVNWYDYERSEWAIDREITHWMPLPEAPKKGGEK